MLVVARRASAVGAVVLAIMAGTPVNAVADEPAGGCPVMASAEVVQIMAHARVNVFLEEPFGAGVPVARTCVDYAVRESWGFASHPYPGAAVLDARDLAAATTGQDLPGYPAYAASQYPANEESSVERAGYALRSRSGETSSEASALAGLGQDSGSAGVHRATTTASVDPAAGTSAATARATAQPITLGGVLALGQVDSVAQARIGSDGKLVRRSSLTIGRTTVAGQVVEITPDGLRAAGQRLPAPDDGPAEALQQAGISLRYLRAEQAGSGVRSAGLEVTLTREDPQTGSPHSVTFTLGRDRTSVV